MNLTEWNARLHGLVIFRALSRASNKALRSNGRHRLCLADVPYIVLQQAAPGGFRAGPPAALHRPAAL